jgi:hypothetical protein
MERCQFTDQYVENIYQIMMRGSRYRILVCVLYQPPVFRLHIC